VPDVAPSASGSPKPTGSGATGSAKPSAKTKPSARRRRDRSGARPRRDPAPRREPHPPGAVITIGIIAACFVAFAYELGTQSSGGDAALNTLFETLRPRARDGGRPGQGGRCRGNSIGLAIVPIVTKHVLHGGWIHLIGNMLYLLGSSATTSRTVRAGRVPASSTCPAARLRP
jgi:membrane associated rhomboid family serine protease